MLPLVSVIIPTYNRAHLLPDTIKSIIDQTYLNIEILVIDDSSTDDTEIVVANFSKIDDRVRYYKRPISKPKGANACRNYGFSISKGEYIVWIDSDDMLKIDAIEKQINMIVKEQTDLCICKTKVFYTEKEFKRKENDEWGSISPDSSPYAFVINGLNWHTASGLWAKKYFISDNIWDEELMNSQEWLMHFTQLCRGVKVAKIYEFLSYARMHKNNISNEKNKKGKYYYNQCLARVKAYDQIRMNRISDIDISKVILSQFNWYILFVLYKKSPLLFIQLIPKFISLNLKVLLLILNLDGRKTGGL